ncbi:MAG: Cof-type HAD-IIB family hydrolase [Eubacteriales bacterium]|nr:Cof-type HAD-IIB family hydrolase [Eubacteriales bacterium]
MNIRLIALDLDGTTMNSENHLSKYNRQTLEEAAASGVHVVVASGRAFDSLPKEVLQIPGIHYAISSNGAHITDLRSGKYIYSSYLEPETVELAIELAQSENLMVEAFCEGKPYIAEELYEDIRVNGSVYRNQEYVLTTRKPISNIYKFMEENRDKLENINFFFYNENRLREMSPKIHALPNCNVVSSVKNNIEIGGLNSSKAKALEVLSEKLEIPRQEIMSFGDAGNDIPMIRYAGFGVAMGNAWEDVKQAADYIAESNDEDGVGKTIRKYVLNR